MTYDTYRIIFYASITLAVACFLLAGALFFLLNIPAVIGDLTGSTERKAIANIRNRSENGTEAAMEFELGKSQKLPGDSRKLGRGSGNTSGMGFVVNTAKINTQVLANEAKEAYETTILSQNNETTLLNETSSYGETSVLSTAPSYGETSLLSENLGFGDTTELNQAMVSMNASESSAYVIEYEIMLIHTDEVIA